MINVKLWLIVCLIINIQTILGSENLIPRDNFVNSNNAWDTQLNSDGTMFAFEAPDGDRKAIWVGATKEPSSAKPLELGKDFQFQSFSWSLKPNVLIAFADTSGDERWQLIAINVSSLNTEKITPDNGLRASLIGLNYADSDEIFVSYPQQSGKPNDLYKISLTEQTSIKVFSNNNNYRDFVLDNQGQLRLMIRTDENGNLIIDKFNSKSQLIKNFISIAFDDSRTFKVIGFSKSSDAFYALDATGRDTTALVKIDLSNGTRTLIKSDNKADLTNVVFDYDAGIPVLVASDYTYRIWYALLPKWQRWTDDVNADISTRVDVISSDRSLQRLSLYYSGTKASYYALYDSLLNQSSHLVAAYPALTTYQFTPKVAFKMTTRDKESLVGTFVAAKGSDKNGDGYPDEPTPMIVMAHGGPWDQSRVGFDTWQQWLSDRGYSVISPNFRGSTGLGKRWLNMGNQQWGEGIYNDVVDSITWAINNGYADPERIGSMGASFGGYISLMLLTQDPDLLSCGISTSASPNLISLYESLPDYWEQFKKEYLLRVGDATSEKGKILLKKHSPLFSADSIKKPLLIFHSENDSRVNIEEPRQIVTAMKKNSQDVTFGIFKNAGHNSVPEKSNRLYKAIAEQFFATCLGGQYEPFTETYTVDEFVFEEGGKFFTVE